MAEHVIARSQTCEFPGCQVPAHRCDLDHRIPYDAAAGTGPKITKPPPDPGDPPPF